MALPNIDFVGKNPTEIKSSIITTYEAIAERALAPGDPVRLFLETIALIISQQRVLIDFSAKQNLLAYASGAYLDHIGQLVGVTRLPAQASIVPLQFTKAGPLGSAVTIPQGTRVTAGNEVQFETAALLVIPAGQTTGTVEAVCTQTGTLGNGYLANQLNKFVDVVAFVASVTNTGISQGGTDVEADEALRERIRTAPDRFSVAGSVGAYRYWALTASSAIVDVAVTQPTPGSVNLYPLLAGGEIPDTAILAAVAEACSADNRRPLTDNVQVLAPQVVGYDVAVQWWIPTENLSQLAAVTATVTQAVAEYVAWQRAKLGRHINPSELVRRMMNAGAKRVALASPTNTAILGYQVAHLNGPATITYVGAENE